MAPLPAMPCSDPCPWQPPHPGGAIWPREGGKRQGGDGETIKTGRVSLIVLSIKALVVRPLQGSYPAPRSLGSGEQMEQVHQAVGDY